MKYWSWNYVHFCVKISHKRTRVCKRLMFLECSSDKHAYLIKKIKRKDPLKNSIEFEDSIERQMWLVTYFVGCSSIGTAFVREQVSRKTLSWLIVFDLSSNEVKFTNLYFWYDDWREINDSRKPLRVIMYLLGNRITGLLTHSSTQHW